MWCDYATCVFSCWLLHCCVLWLCWLSNFGKGQSWVFLNLTKIIIITIGQSVSCVACAWTEKFSIHPTSAHSLFYLRGYYATGSFTIGIIFLNCYLLIYLLLLGWWWWWQWLRKYCEMMTFVGVIGFFVC